MARQRYVNAAGRAGMRIAEALHAEFQHLGSTIVSNPDAAAMVQRHIDAAVERAAERIAGRLMMLTAKRGARG